MCRTFDGYRVRMAIDLNGDLKVFHKDEIKFSCSYGIADINSDSSDDIEDKVLLLVENAEELEK